MPTTTIAVRLDTKRLLDDLKAEDSEDMPYDDVLRALAMDARERGIEVGVDIQVYGAPDE
jgi:hypothetical protein